MEELKGILALMPSSFFFKVSLMFFLFAFKLFSLFSTICLLSSFATIQNLILFFLPLLEEKRLTRIHF